jgi:hypothetical protein
MKPQAVAFQIPLSPLEVDVSPVHEMKIREAYANDGATSCEARIAMELEYAPLLTPTEEFNRKLVRSCG